MTIPINITLYRLLVKAGASEAEAEVAASVDASQLATKADLLAAKQELHATIIDVKASILMWMIAALIAQTALLLAVLRGLRP